MEKCGYKVGDKVFVTILGKQVSGTITSIEYDDLKRDTIAVLDCGKWVYIWQINGLCHE